MKDKYLIIGPLYDLGSIIYSFNQIAKCKVAMHDRIKPDMKILFAGVGHGRDAIAAADLGAEVTVVDLSQTMLKRLNKNIKNKEFKHPIRQLHKNILHVDEFSTYDIVFANFFLNLFSKEMMLKILSHLTKLAKKEGSVVVGDFAPPSGNLISKFFQIIYWWFIDFVFWVIANNELHPFYDYQKSMQDLGLEIKKVKYFRMLFDDRYCSILGQKK
jgi:demethylmenaquinone methyltransferase/2-methoxy-6-polyprenyl-1,4-benzoquinol methylase